MVVYTSKVRPARVWGEQDTYDFAFRAVVVLQHLHIGILRQAVLTHRRKVCALPAGPVEILFDLRRHFDMGLF